MVYFRRNYSLEGRGETYNALRQGQSVSGYSCSTSQVIPALRFTPPGASNLF